MANKINVSIKNVKGSYKPFNLFQYFDDGIRKRLPKGLARDFKEDLIKNIDRNTFGFQLSDRWVNYKRRIGADTRPFVMFSHYKNAISIVTDNGHLAVGFKKTAMHPRAKISMGKLAIQLEYGDVSKNIPARPLWRKTARKYFRGLNGNVRKLMLQALENKKR